MQSRKENRRKIIHICDFVHYLVITFLALRFIFIFCSAKQTNKQKTGNICIIFSFFFFHSVRHVPFFQYIALLHENFSQDGTLLPFRWCYFRGFFSSQFPLLFLYANNFQIFRTHTHTPIHIRTGWYSQRHKRNAQYIIMLWSNIIQFNEHIGYTQKMQVPYYYD